MLQGFESMIQAAENGLPLDMSNVRNIIYVISFKVYQITLFSKLNLKYTFIVLKIHCSL